MQGHRVKDLLRAKDKIIVALDVASPAEARDLVQQLSSQIGWFKIGLQLFTAAGPAIVREIKQTGAKVFLDLKLHDIPNTVRHAVRSARELGADMFTIHLCGGAEMCRAAVEACSGSSTSLLGVTVLTSQNDQTLAEVGIKANVAEQALLLATLAKATGVSGLIASPHEISSLRERFGSYFTIVTPGVRPIGADQADQKRVMTPAQALNAGSDFLVIGRSITGAADPLAALNQILAEVGE